MRIKPEGAAREARQDAQALQQVRCSPSLLTTSSRVGPLALASAALCSKFPTFLSIVIPFLNSSDFSWGNAENVNVLLQDGFCENRHWFHQVIKFLARSGGR